MQSYDRTEIMDSLREKASSDPAFRALLLADPAAAVSEVLGVSVPPTVRISVHVESPADIHLVIPALDALSDSDLELVAGGDWAYVSCAQGCE